MKPLNADDQGCNPISSNCVIWQGPDIPCVNLCKGDSVSAVVAKLAEELCNILDILDIEAYDLSCFNLTDCAPADFQQLIQLLIQRICDLEGVDPSTPVDPVTGCPDCVVDIADCFYFTNPQGDTETTMQLVDYVTAIGNRLCTLIGQIDTINSTLDNHEERISTLENADAPELNIPGVTPVCVLPSNPTSVELVVAELERQFCELTGATGGAIDIYTAILKQCSGLNDATQLNSPEAMSAIVGWQGNVANLADAINNIWLTICDLRAAVITIQENCCSDTVICDGVIVNFTGYVEQPDRLFLDFTGTIPAGYQESNGSTLITISDGASSTTANVSIENNINGGPVLITLPPTINSSANLTVTVPVSFVNQEGSVCNTTLVQTITNTSSCPDNINFTPTQTSIAYSFTYLGGSGSVTIELFNSSMLLVYSNVVAVTGPQSISDTIAGLVANSQYKFRISITPTGSEVTTACPDETVITLPNQCNAATGLGLNITIP